MQVPFYTGGRAVVKQFHEGRRCPVSALQSKIAPHTEHQPSPVPGPLPLPLVSPWVSEPSRLCRSFAWFLKVTCSRTRATEPYQDIQTQRHRAPHSPSGLTTDNHPVAQRPHTITPPTPHKSRHLKLKDLSQFNHPIPPRWRPKRRDQLHPATRPSGENLRFPPSRLPSLLCRDSHSRWWWRNQPR
jgi:hypothetical protein